MSDSPKVACLLPARNCEHDLAGYFESVERFADVVVALDDGSTDGTRDVLRAHPLVRRLITNAPRPTYFGWNDSENRNRLLDAASEFEPEWVVSLDADERIDADDAEALRAFLVSDALPGCAFGFQHFRMWGEDRYDPAYTWLYRLFSYRPGQQFPDGALHINPVPTSIPRTAWINTTIRVQHFGASSEERRTERLAKYRAADPDELYPVEFGGLADPPPAELARWGPRPLALPVLVGMPAQVAAPPVEPRRASLPSRSRLICLLPARNCEHDLAGYFESVGRFADAVVALDDGSTDGTRAVLETHPLVERLLVNPVRDGYQDWDDAENRNRLLAAAADLRPDWVLQLDADERIDAGDARALREFVDQGAAPGCAYGLRVYRTVEDLSGYDEATLWAYRLFAFEPGQRLPEGRLHAVPVPRSIPPDRWMKTTIRIQHLGGASETRRAERFRKYREADPDNVWQESYENLLAAGGRLRPWEPRPPGLHALARSNGHSGVRSLEAEVEHLDLDGPVLSAVVIAQNDEECIERSVRALVEQDCPVPFEVIVVTSGSDRTAAIVREGFPTVTVIELPRPALPGEARNAGLRVTRGDYVTFPGSHIEVAPGSLAARVRAHELGYAMVTATVLNGTDTPAGWASYFLDHSNVLPGRPSEELAGPPSHCSYMREHLIEVGGFPEGMRTGEDTVVNVELTRRGYRGYREREARFIHRSPCRSGRVLLKHHFRRGRGLGRMILGSHRHGGRILRRDFLARFLRRYVGDRVSTIGNRVRTWGDEDLEQRLARSRRLVVLGALAACAGLWYELLRPARGKWRILTGRPGLTLLAAGLDGWPSDPYPGRTDVLIVMRLDFIDRSLKLVSLPRDLLVDIPGHGPNRINAAYNLGRWQAGDDRAGAELMRRSVSGACGVKIDHHVIVKFNGFRWIVDALGGIELEVPDEIHDETPGGFTTHFDRGRQRMDGKDALNYVRTRAADGMTWRSRRQLDAAQALVEALKRTRSPARLARVFRLANQSLDGSLGLAAKVRLGGHLVRIRPGRIDASQVRAPLVTPKVMPNGAAVMEGRLEAIREFVERGLGMAPVLEAAASAESRPTYLSPHFRLEEFHCHDGTPVPPQAYAAVSRLCQQYLEPMRQRFGPATVCSGYRTESHNERVGGTVFSRHVYELHTGCAAADVEFQRGTPADWAAYAEELGAGGVGRYDRLHFVHVDNRREALSRWHEPEPGRLRVPASTADAA